MDLLLIRWVFIFHVYLQGSAAVSFISPFAGSNITARVGSSLNFSWTFQGGFSVITFTLLESPTQVDIDDKDKVAAIQIGGQVSLINRAYAGRLNVSWNKQTNPGEVMFSLSSIQAQDSRLYGCQIRPTTFLKGPVVDRVNLVVIEKPKIDDPSVGKSYNEGLPVNITCTSRGIPDPNVEWRRNGLVLSSGSKTASLTFANIRRSDDGNYTCRACNSEGCDDFHIALVVNYPPTIHIVTASSLTSWVGQTVTFKCQSDGVPTPTLAWYQPDGNQIFRVTKKEITVEVTLNDGGDFGNYTCVAKNGLTPTAERTVKINQIKKPGQASIISTEADVQASSLTVRWTAPADDGGSPITAYRLVVLKGDMEINSVNITGLPKTNHNLTGLERETNYMVKVFARNYVFEGDPAVKTLKTKFKGPPEVVKIDELPIETKDDTITLKWKEPGSNGKVISQYTVYQRRVTDGKEGDWKEIGKIMDVKDRQLEVKVKKGEVYEFAITATNVLGEGLKQDVPEIRRVKVIGIPAAVEIYGLPKKATEDTITLRWIEPKDNGKKITQYTVYRRTVVDGKADREWTKIKEISEVKVREFKVKLERGKVYQFAVTATNGVGESSKPDEKEIPQIEALGSSGPTKGSPVGGQNGMNTAIYSGAAVAGVLLIIGIIMMIVLWKRKKPPSPDEMAMDELGSANHYETDDGYQEVSRAEAARRHQASGPDDEANYAQVDMTKKKKNRPPPSDEYAQVDKPKKKKNRPKRPGELDYADLEDLRVGLVPGPSGATTAAAVVRPPAYEGTDYADITQFGVPQPDPTYANVSKGDVTYSNMQSIT